MAESKNPSLSKEVMQGIALATVLVAIFVLIGNQIAVATGHPPETATTKTEAAPAPAVKTETKP